MSISVQLSVNGKPVALDCPANTTLVDFDSGAVGAHRHPRRLRYLPVWGLHGAS